MKERFNNMIRINLMRFGNGDEVKIGVGVDKRVRFIDLRIGM